MAQPPPFPARLPPPFRAFPPPFPGPAVRPAPFAVGPVAPPPFFLPPPPPAGEGGPRFPPGVPYLAAAPPRAPAEEEAVQRQQDELWLSQFLGRRYAAPSLPPPPAAASPSSARAVAVAALGRVARLTALCQALRRSEDEGDEPVWARTREEAEAALRELREVVRPLRKPGYGEALRRKAERARKRRLRLQRRKHEARAAKEEEAARAAEREAKIDQWRAKCIQEVEEKNRVRSRAPSPASPRGSRTARWSRVDLPVTGSRRTVPAPHLALTPALQWVPPRCCMTSACCFQGLQSCFFVRSLGHLGFAIIF